MNSITGLEKEQRDALIYWIKDMNGKDPIIINDPDYLTETEGSHMETQETRRESYEIIKPDAAARRRVILEILAENENGMTAREIAGELHRRGITPTNERNYAAPRLTELYQAGKVKTSGKKPCPQSGRNVAVWTAFKQ